MAIFSQAEMKRRMDGMLEGLRARKLDGLFLHTADNVFYLSGVPLLSAWGRPMWAVVGGDGSACVVGAELEKENMEQNTSLGEIRVYADEENVWEACLKLSVDFIQEHATNTGTTRRLGVERSLLPVGTLEALSAALPGVEFAEAGDLLADLRLVKSEEELRLLRIGGDVAKIGANAFLEALAENTSELAVAAFAVSEMNRGLAALLPEAATSAYAYCQAGEHTLTPHHHPTGRRIRRGEVVALNVFPVIWGYCMELERTFVFGAPTREQANALAAVREAFEAAKVRMVPGASLADIDRLTRGMLKERGLGEYVRHGTGHAHGIMIGAAGREEGGEVRLYNPGRFVPGMVSSVEPGVYVPGLGGFRHSDVMLITAGGADCLTVFQRDIEYGA